MTGFITTFSYMCTMCLSSLCHPVMCLSYSHSSPSSFFSSLVCCRYFLGVCEPMGCTRVAREACMGTMPAATPLGKMLSHHLKSTVHNEKFQEQEEAGWEILQNSKSLTTTGGFRDKRPVLEDTLAQVTTIYPSYLPRCHCKVLPEPL